MAKAMCKTCGSHFPEEFEVTVGDHCTFWEQHGFPKDFPKEYKRKIWDWYFELPVDEIAHREHVAVRIAFDAVEFAQDDFGAHIQNWLKLSEKERHQFQDDMFKHRNGLSEKTVADMWANFFISTFVKSNPKWKKKIKLQ